MLEKDTFVKWSTKYVQYLFIIFYIKPFFQSDKMIRKKLSVRGLPKQSKRMFLKLSKRLDQWGLGSAVTFYNTVFFLVILQSIRINYTWFNFS